jgi:hypothetical protein
VSWPTAAVLLLGVAALGVLVGRVRVEVGTGLLAGAMGILAAVVFLPGVCVTAIAASPPGESPEFHGSTSCETLYGVGLPDVGRFGEDETGLLLALTAGTIAVATVVLTRRRRNAAPGKSADDGR